jgi:hypothetical protein
MKVKHITKEEELEVGKTYFEIMRNSAGDTEPIGNSLRYKIAGVPVPYPYPEKSPSLKDTRWIWACYIWRDGRISKPDIMSLQDMGIGPAPYNNHQIYEILEGNFEDLIELTFQEFYLVEGSVFAKPNKKQEFLDAFNDCGEELYYDEGQEF